MASAEQAGYGGAADTSNVVLERQGEGEEYDEHAGDSELRAAARVRSERRAPARLSARWICLPPPWALVLALLTALGMASVAGCLARPFSPSRLPAGGRQSFVAYSTAAVIIFLLCGTCRCSWRETPCKFLCWCAR